MKANELMIGDFIRQKQGICAGCVLQLTEVHELEHANNYEPIPLTEEILIANGFRESIEEGVYYFPERYQEVNNRGFAVETEGDGKWFITDHQLIEFSHVHKFQHILRDCEMTDLADNFKVSPN